MTEAWRLPYRAIDCSAATSVVFWSSVDDIEENPHLQIIFRKADVRKKGYTRGWEIFLSHEIKTGRTRGFCKGTSSSSIVECLQDFKACISETAHPMFLPFLILTEELSYKIEVKHREARDWLRRIEHAVSSHAGDDKIRGDGIMPLDVIHQDINECYAKTLWKSPSTYIRVIDSFLDIMELLLKQNPSAQSKQLQLQKIHDRFIPALKLYRVTIVLAQRDSRLQYDMGKLQYEMALASKRDSSAMKTISILGIVFLPGIFVAVRSSPYFRTKECLLNSNPKSILSTTFFDFKNASSIRTSVAPSFWIYWVITIPVTLIILGLWYFWERKRDKTFVKEVDEKKESNEEDFTSDMKKPTEHRLEPLMQNDDGNV
ncbi:hypothetical protein BOTCAL_0775g00040 [Botryotinia calthae]|uniref:Uncharacterized protein n=1 Tax=Botryotinia calthae TaxID=38488 RepID=A0A4Y8CG49_9HELO|nr:hypothetical protein BOTCAL_0775g00040 [Botryotinia calthae]